MIFWLAVAAWLLIPKEAVERRSSRFIKVLLPHPRRPKPSGGLFPIAGHPARLPLLLPRGLTLPCCRVIASPVNMRSRRTAATGGYNLLIVAGPYWLRAQATGSDRSQGRELVGRINGTIRNAEEP